LPFVKLIFSLKMTKQIGKIESKVALDGRQIRHRHPSQINPPPPLHVRTVKRRPRGTGCGQANATSTSSSKSSFDAERMGPGGGGSEERGGQKAFFTILFQADSVGASGPDDRYEEAARGGGGLYLFYFYFGQYLRIKNNSLFAWLGGCVGDDAAGLLPRDGRGGRGGGRG
jgi:hypothetical protein